jgi:Beta propeller domain
MRRLGLASWLALALASAAVPAAAQSDRPALDRDPAVLALTADRLTRFESDADLRRYLRRVQNLIRDRRAGMPGPAQFAQVEDVPCATPEECPEVANDAGGDIVMTGTRISSSSSSITNNQKAGVDEGDIVKQIGRFLLVLQDGRLFVVDTGGPSGLALADRTNVYRDPGQDTWYDEMLVHGNRVVVTGYSYDESATELSVFRLGDDGRLAREGTFYLSSNDYYDVENYATRIAGGRLVVYTPIALVDMEVDGPVEWPVIRRWLPGEDSDKPSRRGTRLLDARDVYRPVQPTLEPVIHTVSICPLGEPSAGTDLRCRATGFIGPARREWYVSPTDAYLWVSPGWDDLDRLKREDERCGPGHRPPLRDAAPAMLFRVPLAGREPSALGVRGVPINQFSLESHEGEFRALVLWNDIRCELGWEEDEHPGADPAPPLTYFESRLDRFAAEVREAPDRAFTAMPSPRTRVIENRFTERYLVYGGRDRWSSYPPYDEDEAEGPARVVVVPVNRPDRPALLEVPHNVIRVERAGDNMVLSGYRDFTGLDLSLVDLARGPRVASTARLPGRYESEGRSHAFNSLVEADGSGLMGLPTVAADQETGRYPWHSDASDVSFLSADAAGRLAALGELVSGENRPGAGVEKGPASTYECEVSCVDWYGNSRPIFTDGRVFGLTGTELIEGRVEGGRIRELRRLDLTAPKPAL